MFEVVVVVVVVVFVVAGCLRLLSESFLLHAGIISLPPSPPPTSPQ